MLDDVVALLQLLFVVLTLFDQAHRFFEQGRGCEHVHKNYWLWLVAPRSELTLADDTPFFGGRLILDDCLRVHHHALGLHDSGLVALRIEL